MRSATGPDSRARYASARPGGHTHRRTGSPSKPQGQGLPAQTSSGRAGKRALIIARVTSMRPSSSGWRRASSTEGAKAQTSSRKSTPWWARLTSPGRGSRPPPTSPAADTVW